MKIIHTLQFRPRTAAGVLLLASFSAALLASCGSPSGGQETPVTGPTPSPTSEVQMTPSPNNSTPGSMPSDFSVVYSWRAGSMPPPYHYEYDITIGPGAQGKIDYSPDYPGTSTPKWTETFPVTDQQLASLYSTAVSTGVLGGTWPTASQPKVGGPVDSAEVTAGGKHYGIPYNLDDTSHGVAQGFYDAVKGLVPQATWDKLENQRQQYMQDYQQKHR